MKNTHLSKALCIVLLLLAVLASGCGNMTQGKSSADAAVVAFHQQFNAQKMDAIAAAASPEMFKATPKPDMIALFEAVHKKLGNAVSSQNTNCQIQNWNGATSVALVQNTKFEKGTGTETFNYRIEGGKAYLLGYFINSNDLIMK